jgi:hypothetical protein
MISVAMCGDDDNDNNDNNDYNEQRCYVWG